ncbi:MAG: hypothetical protein ACM3MG_06405 [Bacillota bacterium]
MDKSVNFNIPSSSLTVTAQAGRPVLGEFLQINLFTVGEFEPLITLALQKVADLEKALDLDDESSEISKLLNLQGDDTSEISAAVGEVIEEALNLSVLSSGAFELFRDGKGLWEIRSLIRGYIVDQTVKCLIEQEPSLKGVVHLAEGMRFFNCPKKSIQIRIGKKIDREIGLVNDAISTTEAQGSPYDQESSVVYLKPLRRGITGRHAVSVIADTCVNANALAYIGLYAKPAIVQMCVNELKAQLIIFDENGEITEIYDEESPKAYSYDPLRTSYLPYDDNNRD